MLLQLDFESEVPIYMQIRNQIVVGIAEGSLAPGERLPTIRALANESGINMMTVSKAYQLLKAEGYIATDRRSGAVVRGTPPKALDPRTLESLHLAAAEARLAGMGEEEFLALCADLFNK